MKIAFIGSGVVANAMITGILKGKIIQPNDIFATDGDVNKLTKFKEQGIHTSNNNQEAVDFAELIFLTIKPQQYTDVMSQLTNTKDKVFVTVAPGITTTFASAQLNGAKVVRTMPNTPALIGEGVTAVCRGENISELEFAFIKYLLSSFSTVFELEESQMNDAVALSGSSPAYTYMFAEAIANHSTTSGIDFNTALKMAALTIIGSAKMILQSGEQPSTLRDKVCSKGGTTEKAVEQLNKLGFAEIISKAMEACNKRAKELSIE
jgi:pyrroline-5-carboxylate reductase